MKANKILVTDVTTIKSVKSLRKNVSKSEYTKNIENEYAKFESVSVTIASKLIDAINIARVNAVIEFVMNDERTPQEYKDAITKASQDVNYLTQCATTNDILSIEYFVSNVFSANVSVISDILNKIYGKSEKSESKRIRKVVSSLLPISELEEFEGANLNTTKINIMQLYGTKFALTDNMIQSICNICYWTLKGKEK